MEEFYPYEIGSDHDSNIEGDFIPWFEGLVEYIKKLRGQSNQLESK